MLSGNKTEEMLCGIYYPALVQSGNRYAYCGNSPIVRYDFWGNAWTEDDQKAYDRLIENGEHLKAFEFKNTIDFATYQYEAAKGNIVLENNAHYNAVVARQEVYDFEYVDNFDYTRGRDNVSFVGVHEVALGQYHTSVTIFVNQDSVFWNNPEFENNIQYGGKVRYITFGAGNKDGKLRSDTNREKDILIDIKQDWIYLGSLNHEKIFGLFTAETAFHFDKSVEYNLFPHKDSTGYNSNSFTRGILNASSIFIPRSPIKSVPGWDKPLPAHYFE